MELTSKVANFLAETDNLRFEPISNGHINNTFLVTDAEGKKYILQKINTAVFPAPENIAHNHLEVNRILEEKGYKRHLLKPVIGQSANYLDAEEKQWRLLEFIEDSHTHLKVPNPETAYKAAEAFSEFYAMVNSGDLSILDPLPGFINFEKRIADYRSVLETAPENLKNAAAEEISFVNAYLDLPAKWIDSDKKGHLPRRVIHADPKISNTLFGSDGEVLAVIDLDTVMYGTLLYDFGDMIRSYTNTADEDDAGVPNNFSPEIYSEVKRGFLSHLESVLTDNEKSMLDYASEVVIYIQAVRFLADYLGGSTYYSIKYPEHNLHRTKNQINLLKGLMQHHQQTV